MIKDCFMIDCVVSIFRKLVICVDDALLSVVDLIILDIKVTVCILYDGNPKPHFGNW